MQKKPLSQLKKTFSFSKIELIEPVFQPDQNLTEDELSVYIDTYVEQSIAYQNQEFEKWKSANIEIPLHSKARAKKRYRMVLLCSFLSFCILIIMLWLGLIPTTAKIYELLTFDFLPNWWFELPQPPKEIPSSPVFFSFITVLASAPVAYAIWMIRDENAAQQIENSRKDTNLKDFQRLSEWASGFHLPEDKVVQSEKTIFKGTEKTVEITSTLENFAPPEAGFSLARRTGAESLQVAAIYQIQDFMRGKYGENFMKPAFYLLLSIWEGLVRPLLPQNETCTKDEVIKTQKAIKNLLKTPLARAINNTLTCDNGMIFILFRKNLSGAFLAGLESHDKIMLSGLNMDNCDLRFINLTNLKGYGSSLKHSILDGSVFHNEKTGSKTNFIKNDFRHSSINFCNLSFSEIYECNFLLIHINNSIFQGCNIQNSIFNNTTLKDTEIDNSTFKNNPMRHIRFEFCDLKNSTIDNCNISGIKIENTNCVGLKADSSIFEKYKIPSSIFNDLKESGTIFINTKNYTELSPQPNTLSDLETQKTLN